MITFEEVEHMPMLRILREEMAKDGVPEMQIKGMLIGLVSVLAMDLADKDAIRVLSCGDERTRGAFRAMIRVYAAGMNEISDRAIEAFRKALEGGE